MFTHFGFFLKVESVDLLQLALQAKEEGGFVGLQRGLRVLESLAIGGRLLRGEDWGGAQFLDELWFWMVSSRHAQWRRMTGCLHTFLSAL